MKPHSVPATGVTKDEHDAVVKRRRRNYTDDPISRRNPTDDTDHTEPTVIDVVMDKIERGEL